MGVHLNRADAETTSSGFDMERKGKKQFLEAQVGFQNPSPISEAETWAAGEVLGF